MDDKEYWRTIYIDNVPIPYYISTYGRIYSIKNNTILKPGISKKGYHIVVLYYNKQKKTKFVHRLVAEAFIPVHWIYEDQVNHKNGIKYNNSVWNLEWCTNKENITHASMMGLLYRHHGEDHHYAKYSNDIIFKVCELISLGYSNTEIMEYLNILNRDTIKSIRSYKTYRWMSQYFIFPKYTNKQIEKRLLARDVCMCIINGKNNKEIRQALHLENTRAVHDFIKGIRSNSIYKDVISDVKGSTTIERVS